MLSSSVIDVPRPLIDPINSLVEALSIVSLALPRPRRNCSVVLALDRQRRGLHLFRTYPMSAQTLHRIVHECSHVPTVHSVVVVSHTTSTPMSLTDEDMWHCAQRVLAAAGIRLMDWAIVGAGGVYCPRTLCGTPDPWPYGSTCM